MARDGALSDVNLRILGSRERISGSPPSFSLENIITNLLPDGAVCWVQSAQAEFRFYREDTTAADGIDIIAPIAGPGRWRREGAAGAGIAVAELHFADAFGAGGTAFAFGAAGVFADLVLAYTQGNLVSPWVNEGNGILRWDGPRALMQVTGRLTAGEQDAADPFAVQLAFAFDTGAGFVTDQVTTQADWVGAVASNFPQAQVNISALQVFNAGNRVRLRAAQQSAQPTQDGAIFAAYLSAVRVG